MAQTKTKKASSKGSAAAQKPQARSRGSTKKSANSRKPSNSSKSAPTEMVGNAADKATTAVGNAADKAKIPLVAGGAALAGAAGGAMLGARQARRKRSAAARLGDFALQMQRARQTPNGSKQYRSPVEVVLEGLTSRRSRA
jgi:hypothetical protein